MDVEIICCFLAKLRRRLALSQHLLNTFRIPLSTYPRHLCLGFLRYSTLSVSSSPSANGSFAVIGIKSHIVICHAHAETCCHTMLVPSNPSHGQLAIQHDHDVKTPSPGTGLDTSPALEHTLRSRYSSRYSSVGYERAVSAIFAR